ncbi:hypothetical protein SAMN06265222_11966 [Neorhodopirellula lusitana]|uniref:Uncharacterized protein n=1 Tax=Neorhodopirellula lusitana TaxID=445327 RepID=A0ABY1QN70_9BACT|nr:hypothetical protein SAMN06265222_11966 [Neorhodopirellula lusitana]
MTSRLRSWMLSYFLQRGVFSKIYQDRFGAYTFFDTPSVSWWIADGMCHFAVESPTREIR